MEILFLTNRHEVAKRLPAHLSECVDESMKEKVILDLVLCNETMLL